MPAVPPVQKFEAAADNFAGSIQKKRRPLPPLPGPKQEQTPVEALQDQKFKKYKQAVGEQTNADKKRTEGQIGSHRDPKAVQEAAVKQAKAQAGDIMKSLFPSMQHAPSSTPVQTAEIEARHAMQLSPSSSAAPPTRVPGWMQQAMAMVDGAE